MRSFASFVLVCVGCSPLLAAASPGLVTVQLTADVTIVGWDSTDTGVTIHLSGNAFAAGVRVPLGAAVRLIDGNCAVRIALPPGPPPAIRTLPSPDGQVTITVGAGNEMISSASAAIDPPAAAAHPIPSPTTAPATTTAPASTSAPRGPEPTDPNLPPPLSPRTPGAPPVANLPVENAAASMAALPAAALQDLVRNVFEGADPIEYDVLDLADFATPESPAAAALGATSTLQRPATPRETLTSVLSKFDEDGKLLAGFSVGVTPFTLLRSEPLTGTQYQTDHVKRFLANLQVSLAAQEQSTTESGDKPARFSAGVSVVFFDHGDLRRDNGLLVDIVKKLNRPIPDREITNRLPESTFAESNLNEARALWDQRKAEKWNAASAGMGFAPVWVTSTGSLSEADSDGIMTWASLALPGPGSMQKFSQFILGGTGRFGAEVENEGELTKLDTLDFGAQLRFGSPAFNGLASAVYRRRSFDNTGSDSELVYEVGLERRISKGLWLNLIWTHDDAIAGGKSLRTGIRYGFGDKAVLSDPSKAK